MIGAIKVQFWPSFAAYGRREWSKNMRFGRQLTFRNFFESVALNEALEPPTNLPHPERTRDIRSKEQEIIEGTTAWLRQICKLFASLKTSALYLFQEASCHFQCTLDFSFFNITPIEQGTAPAWDKLVTGDRLNTLTTLQP